MELQDYTFEQLDADIEKVKPRFFDTYVLSPFLIWYSIQSKGMGKNVRRILFTSGVYIAYRNYANYKTALANLYAMQTTGTPV